MLDSTALLLAPFSPIQKKPGIFTYPQMFTYNHGSDTALKCKVTLFAGW